VQWTQPEGGKENLIFLLFRGRLKGLAEAARGAAGGPEERAADGTGGGADDASQWLGWAPSSRRRARGGLPLHTVGSGSSGGTLWWVQGSRLVADTITGPDVIGLVRIF